MKLSWLMSVSLLSGMVLSSCAAWTQVEDRFVVQFETEVGPSISDQLVSWGGLVNDPNVSVPGYLFHGWYRTEAPTANDTPWNFNVDVVVEPLILYAKWTAEMFTLSFISDGDLDIPSMDVIFGDPVDLPEPTRSGFTFVDWYQDPLFEEVFVAESREAQDYVLYAKWVSYPVLRVQLLRDDLVNVMNDFGTRFIGERQLISRVEACESNCQDLQALETLLAGEDAPLLFQLPFDGNNTRALLDRFSPYMLDLTTQPWVRTTDVALWHNQKVVGFPLYLKGTGMIYNNDLLNQYNALSGVTRLDPSSWYNYQSFADALVAIHARRTQLGLSSVISFAGNGELNDIFNAYLSSGKTIKDNTVLLDLELGRHPPFRVDEYANWVKLISDFSFQNTLLNGTTATQLSAFVNRQAMMMPYTPGINDELKRVFAIQNISVAPLGQFANDGRGVPVHADRSWVFVNAKASEAMIELAKAMLVSYTNDIPMRNQIVFTFGHIHAFRNSLLSQTSNRMNAAIATYYSNEEVNPYLYDELTQPSKKATLAALHRRWFAGEITRNQFITQLKTWIESYPT